MARSAKTTTDKVSDATPPKDAGDIPDAEVIAETVSDVVEPFGSKTPRDMEPAAGEPTEAEGVAEGAEVTPSPVKERVEEAMEVAPEPVQEPPTLREEAVTASLPPRAAAAVTVQKVGFFPLVLGGVVAAGLGFVAGWQGLLPVPGDVETQAALAEQLARIEEVAAGVAEMPDLTPLQAEIAALREGIAPFADRITALEERIAALERAPANDGTLSANAIAAWQADIDALKSTVAEQAVQAGTIADLQAAMAAQEAEMARMVEQAAQRLDAAQSTVAEIEQEATATATATLRRAVIASLQTAVDSGQPYASLIGELAGTGVDVPEGLTAGAEGVATLTGLTESFPEAARAALAAARAEGLAEDGGNGVMAFLRRQLDVRSVEPREGSDPDAVLSRAEAALRDARLGDALAEIATLPEPVRVPLADWIAAAEIRVAALTALQALVETLPVPETSN